MDTLHLFFFVQIFVRGSCCLSHFDVSLELNSGSFTVKRELNGFVVFVVDLRVVSPVCKQVALHFVHPCIFIYLSKAHILFALNTTSNMALVVLSYVRYSQKCGLPLCIAPSLHWGCKWNLDSLMSSKPDLMFGQMTSCKTCLVIRYGVNCVQYVASHFLYAAAKCPWLRGTAHWVACIYLKF